MAKIKHNNFLDTVDAVISNAKQEGVVHLYAEGENFNGRKIRIKGKDHFHFGTTGYLGLEQDERLKQAAISAIQRYGTQFPLSKTYISHQLYRELEERIYSMYKNPIIITKNSTLGHLAVIPCIIRDEDGVILDHQVHWSVQSAAQILKTRAIPVEMIRHNNLQMLEDKIKSLSSKCNKIWYMADGIYSMFGDFAPIGELMELCKKYPQLHLYFDDVHGMSWRGKNGTGFVMDVLKELPENVLLFGTLSKTFGASGAVLVCPNKELHSTIKNFGGPLTFSAQLEPASVAAASASAAIHLSPEIYELQNMLFNKINFFNSLLAQTDLPLVEINDSPVFYIGTGMPVTGYKFVQRLMSEGFYTNLGLFPAVPVKNTGVRITISRHNNEQEIKGLVDAMAYHYPLALQETGSNNNRVRQAFNLSELKEENVVIRENLQIQSENSIKNIDKEEWDKLLGRRSTFDWNGLVFMEEAFRDQEKPENNWSFHYYIIRDQDKIPVLATFFTYALWKDDMLAPATVSLKLEEQRKNNPYLLTSYVLSMGSLFSEGEHLFLASQHPQFKDALSLLHYELESLEKELDAKMIVLRDFSSSDLNNIFHEQGFFKVNMPDSCVFDNLAWSSIEKYTASLSSRSRRHFLKDIRPYENFYDIIIEETISAKDLDICYELYLNVKKHNMGLNTFSYPRNLFERMNRDDNWEFIILRLKEEFSKGRINKPVGVMFCYKNLNYTFVPNYIGMDYAFTEEFQIYRQLLFQTIKRARALKFQKIDFGMTASFEKKKVGATVIPQNAFIQTRENFSIEMMGLLQNESK